MEAFASILFNLPLPQLSLVCALTGIGAHLSFWIHGEKYRNVNQAAFLIFIGPPLVTLGFYRILTGTVHEHNKHGTALLQSIKLTIIIYSFHLLGLFTSILTYRLFFHPLRHFPGPFFAKLTKFYSVYEQIKTRQQWHRKLRKLHDQYGDIVRIGPNELSIRRPNLSQTLGSYAKGTFYEFGHSGLSVHTTRDMAVHKDRRKIWDTAFTLQAIQKGYVPRIIQHANETMDCFYKYEVEGKTINFTDQFHYQMFDLMGDLAFGKREGFGLVKGQGEGDSMYFLKVTHGSSAVMGYMMHVPWAFRLLSFIESMIAHVKMTERKAFFLWTEKLIQDKKAEIDRERKIQESEGKGALTAEKDILQYLIEAERVLPSSTPSSEAIQLPGEARTAVFAASDTTANILATLFFHLASSPQHLKALQSEIDALYARGKFTATRGNQVPQEVITGGTPHTKILESCINEAQRLNPAIPNGGQRLVPSTGLTLPASPSLTNPNSKSKQHFIPPNTLIWYPFYVNFRNPEIYPDPDRFLPERWYCDSYKDYIRSEKKSDDHVPFWVGKYSCTGKNLALVTLRIVVTMIVREFDIVVIDGWDEERFYGGCRDNFSLVCGGWEGRLRRRKTR